MSSDLPSIRIDAERARAYVLAHGGAREQARLAGILSGAAPDRPLVKALEELQNPDGGFARTAGGPSSLDATCYLLDQLKDLEPLSGSPMASRAVSYLRRSQQPDGSWRESAEAALSAPLWAAPENPKATAYLTALVGATVLTASPGEPGPGARALSWLQKSGALEGQPYPQTAILAWSLRHRLRSPGADAAHAVPVALLQRELEPATLAWTLAVLLEAQAGGTLLLPIFRACVHLAQLQQPDGSWKGEAGLPLEATLTALRVFRGFGIIQEGI